MKFKIEEDFEIENDEVEYIGTTIIVNGKEIKLEPKDL